MIVAIVFAFFFTPLKGYAFLDCEDSVKIGNFEDIDVYLGPHNRAIFDGNYFLFKAKNELLNVDICLVNKGQPKQISIEACSNFDCSFNSSNYDVKYLVSWYKDFNSDKSVSHSKNKEKVLVKELLVRDPNLIIHDNNKQNLLKFIVDGVVRYLSTDDLQKIGPIDAHGRAKIDANRYLINDSEVNLPIIIKDQQGVLLSEKDYESVGDLMFSIRDVNGNKKVFNIPVKMLDFDLNDENFDACIYYRSLFNGESGILWSESKTEGQLRNEFRDILKKGIKYPTAYIYRDYERYMKIRSEFAFPNDKIFLLDNILIKHLKDENWREYKKRIVQIKNDKWFRKYGKIYFYLVDEPDKNKYTKIVEKALPIIKAEKVGLFLAGREENFIERIIDGAVYVLAYEPAKKTSTKFSEHNALVYSYANPQVGVLGYERFRYNYGFKLLGNNYLGFMPYAYQDSRGSVWSDFDSIYRDHMLTYPTSSGIINTLQGVALSDAIVDIKYAQTYESIYKKYRSKCTCGKIQYFDWYNSGGKITDRIKFNIATNIIALQKEIDSCSK